MSPKQYRSSEVSNQATPRLIRFDPSNDSALVAVATNENKSINSLVNTFVAEGLANYYANAAVGQGIATNLLASSVQNYTTTLAYVRDSHQDTITKLSGIPEKEEPHV